jgi:hypothetical protein
MVISNEDKILLLEALGYKYGHDFMNGFTFHAPNGETCITVENFNPLNIFILSELMDIVEEKYSTSLDKDNDDIELPYKFTVWNEKWERWIQGEAIKREEAILEAVLEYFKHNKDGNN